MFIKIPNLLFRKNSLKSIISRLKGIFLKAAFGWSAFFYISIKKDCLKTIYIKKIDSVHEIFP